MTIEEALLSNELTRIGTFINWLDVKGKKKINVRDLVKAGFYFTGSGDVVRCFSCGLKIRALKHHRDPLTVHITKSPHCAFVTDSRCANRLMNVRQHDLVTVDPAEGDKITTSAGSSISNNLVATFRESSAKSTDQQAANQCFTCANAGSPSSSHLSSDYHQTKTSGEVHVTGYKNHIADRSRCSSTSDFTETRRASSRSHIQRAKSDAGELYHGKSSGVWAMRQHSSPRLDVREFQESKEARLETFTRWPGISISRAREFSEAGFIYIGPLDRVKCVFCSGILRCWRSDDSPLEEHCKHFPRCSFVVRYLLARALPKPTHPQYSTEASRLRSFKGWDVNRNPKPVELAQSGFFYTGPRDSVKCFYCNGGLCDWELDDDPWREHARVFPKCHYVRLFKGQSFIDEILSRCNTANHQGSQSRECLQHVAITQNREADLSEVNVRMDSIIVTAVLDMGFSEEAVKKAVSERLAECGDDFTSIEDLLEAVFNLDIVEELKNEPETHLEDKKCENGTHSSVTSRSEGHESASLAEENQLLKEQRQCKICFEGEVSITFTPCGHLVCCSACASALKKCPICRAKIKKMIHVYMS